MFNVPFLQQSENSFGANVMPMNSRYLAPTMFISKPVEAGYPPAVIPITLTARIVQSFLYFHCHSSYRSIGILPLHVIINIPYNPTLSHSIATHNATLWALLRVLSELLRCYCYMFVVLSFESTNRVKLRAHALS